MSYFSTAVLFLVVLSKTRKGKATSSWLILFAGDLAECCQEEQKSEGCKIVSDYSGMECFFNYSQN